MQKKSFFCPYCFRRIKTSDILYTNAACDVDSYAPYGTSAEDRQATRYTPHSAGFFEKLGLAGPPLCLPCNAYLKGKMDCCKKCTQMRTQRVCNECFNILPNEIDKLSDITIAIVGTASSGKSHFIALLILRIRQLFREFGWFLHPLTETTIHNYTDNFYTPLFKNMDVLSPTRSQNTPQPLIYSLEFRKSVGYVRQKQ